MNQFLDFRRILAGVVWLCLTLPTLSQPVVLSELMPSAIGEPEAPSFIEVHNPGSKEISLHGWSFVDGIRFTFTNVTLPANGYWVVAADLAAFHRRYPSVTNVVGNWSGRLRPGEAVALHNASQQLVTRVEFGRDGDWAVRQRGPNDHGHRGWIWSAPVDLGRSLELIEPKLPGDSGQNWAASRVAGGTPGGPNSVASTVSGGLILDVRHWPAVPRSTDPIAITAHFISPSSGSGTAAVRYRVADRSGSAFVSVPMADDGLHQDGAADDGIFGALLPPQPPGTVLEYYVEFTPNGGEKRTWPAPAVLEEGQLDQVTNCLLQVDDEPDSVDSPRYRILLTASDRGELALMSSQLPDGLSNAEFNATFIGWDGNRHHIRHRVSVRPRGHGSRGKLPASYHLEFPQGALWNGSSALNLNAPYSYVTTLGNSFCLRAGLHAPWTYLTQVRVNGADLALDGGAVLTYGSYAAVEVLDGQFAQRHFPRDDQGDLYRGIGSDDTTQEADFRYLGTDPLPYRPVYFKQTNQQQDDWTGLIELCRVLSAAPDSEFQELLPQRIPVAEWVRYLAVMAFMDNQETSPNTGTGDDFALYQGVTDPRFHLLPYDTDTVLGQGFPAGSTNSTLLGSLKIAAFERLLKQPEIAALYVSTLRELCRTVFSPEQAFPMIDQLLGGRVPAPVLENIRRFILGRIEHVQAQFPDRLSCRVDLPSTNGLYSTREPTLAITGRANTATTSGVRVNGVPATWLPLSSTWSFSSFSLHPGINDLRVQALDTNGVEVEQISIRVRLESGASVSPAGPMTTDQTWSPQDGPVRLAGLFTVPPGRTLTIEPGCTIEFLAGARLIVQGCLKALGTVDHPIHLLFSAASGAEKTGLWFEHTLATNELRYVQMHESSSSEALVQLSYSRLSLDHVSFAATAHGAVRSLYSSLTVRDCSFAPATAAPTLFSAGTLPTEDGLLVDRSEFLPSSGPWPALFLTGAKSSRLLPRVKECVFRGGAGAGIELAVAEAYLEGNRFEHFRIQDDKGINAKALVARDNSIVSAVRNLFAENDYGAVVETGSTLWSENNTWVGNVPAAISFEAWPGAGATGSAAQIHGDIFWNNGADLYPGQPSSDEVKLTATHSFLRGVPGPGMMNGTEADPGFVPGDAEYSLTTASVCRRSGRNGLDMGWHVRPWGFVSGVPEEGTPSRQVHLGVSGPGVTHYRYRLNDGPESEDRLVTQPLELTDLATGTYTLQILARNRAGEWQPAEQPTVVGPWRVDPTLPAIVINEVLAANIDPALGGPSLPDMVELYNRSDAPVDLSGLSLTDDLTQPGKFTFTNGPVLPPGASLVLWGGKSAVAPGRAIGFSLKSGGDHVWLFDTPPRGRRILDDLSFGRQLPGFSVGRLNQAGWGLTIPTPGQRNQPAPLGDASKLKINEWSAFSGGSARDFVELFNPEFLPVSVGGDLLTDEPGMEPAGVVFPKLTFLGAHESVPWFVNAGEVLRPDELPFGLSKEVGMLRLFDLNGAPVDSVSYLHQSINAAEGRSPTGAGSFARWNSPTPGALNPGRREVITTTSLHLVSLTNRWRFNQTGADLGSEWRDFEYDDQIRTWSSGRGLFYLGATNGLPASPGTLLLQERPPQTTYYFRTVFRFSGQPASAALNLTHAVDDGAVFYLNGTEIYRFNLPPGPIGAATYSSGSVAVPVALGPFTLPAGPLLEGDNVLAVEVHQRNSSSDDLAFGLNLDAVITSTNVVVAPPVQSERSAIRQTLHSGTLTGNVVWAPRDGEHLILANLVLSPGSELTVLPGTQIRIAAGVSIFGEDARVVLGGTRYAPISMASLDGTNAWGTLTLTGTRAALEMQHTVFRQGGIRLFQGATGLFLDTALSDYTDGINPIIETEGAGPLVMRRCHVTRYNELHLTATPVQIDECLFEEARLDAIDIDQLPAGSAIRNSTLRNGIGDNIDAIDFGTESHGLIENCAIYNFTDKGISVGDSSRDIRVAHTLIHHADRGVGVKDVSSVVLDHVTLAQCRIGLDLFEKTAGLGGGLASVRNSILWDNAASFGVEPGSQVDFSYSDVAGSAVIPGLHNTSLDPQFLNPAAADFRLRKDSPLLRAGEDETDLGPRFPVGGLPLPLESLTAVVRSTRAVQISWTQPVKAERSVTLERSRSGGPWQTLAVLPSTVPFYLDHAVESGKEYAYRACVQNVIGHSDWTEPMTVQSQLDSDEDGLPDDWERSHQLNPTDPSDALEDPDGDGVATLDEYRTHTDPHQPEDVLALRVQRTGSGVLLTFTARAGLSYAIQERNQLPDGAWLEVGVWPAGTTDAVAQFEIPLEGNSGKYYRLVNR